jgi:hypothetical protein
MIEAQHGGKVLGRQARGRFHRDVGSGVGRVADDQHLDVARGDGVERLALHRENLRVRFQQVLALHARAAGSADQRGDVDIFKGGHR